MSALRILVVGSGGREHALAWKLAVSPSVETVYIAPGNGGTASSGKLQNVAIATEDFKSLVDFAVKNDVNILLDGFSALLISHK
jgi:phosphoribosylamine--glycine ligase/phosphoribosylformylglycinamidine cyclo-ligase